MQNKEIKVTTYDILDLKEKYNLKNNLDITCKLYKIFSELSVKCFNKSTCEDKQSLTLPMTNSSVRQGINDNMCNVTLIKNLTCTIYDTLPRRKLGFSKGSGLCDIARKNLINVYV